MKKIFVLIALICSSVTYSQPNEVVLLNEAATVNLGDSIPFLNDNGYSYQTDGTISWYKNQKEDTVFMVNKQNKDVTMSFPFDKIVADEIILFMMEQFILLKATKFTNRSSLLFQDKESFYTITTTDTKTFIQVTR
jgi:hypothetical protein